MESALALVHHLAIARNVQLDEVVKTISDMVPNRIIEFIPKNDPRFRTMLALHEDVFSEYSRESFVAALERGATIIARVTASTSERAMFYFRRR